MAWLAIDLGNRKASLGAGLDAFDASLANGLPVEKSRSDSSVLATAR